MEKCLVGRHQKGKCIADGHNVEKCLVGRRQVEKYLVGGHQVSKSDDWWDNIWWTGVVELCAGPWRVLCCLIRSCLVSKR